MFLSIMLVLTAAGCGTKKVSDVPSDSEVVTLTYNVVGDEPPESEKVFGLINAITEKKIGVKIKPKFVVPDNYTLVMSSGEAFDITYVADWLQFWDFAAKNAFAEIPDEAIEKNAPATIAKSGDFLNAGKIDGKRYAIPQMSKNLYSNVYLVRGDFMNKYHIPEIVTLDDFGKYLDAVAKNEKGITPFDAKGDEAWRLPAIFYNEMKWVSPGAPSAASHILVEAEVERPELFMAIDKPETVAFSKKMKEWNKSGYWSKSAMANKISPYDSFMGGKSASAIVSLSTANVALNETSADDRKSWDVRAFNIYNTRIDTTSYMTSGVAFGKNTKHLDKALQFVDLVHSDKDLYRLLSFGVESENYKLVDEKKYDTTGMATNRYPGTGSFQHGIYGAKWSLDPVGGFPKADEMKAKLNTVYKPSRVLNFRADTTNFADTVAAMNDIYAQYTAPRMMGFVDDVDAAIALEKKKLKDAGITDYMVDLQKQIDKYVSTLTGF
jgi:putative aldouronate transport system substrate-binding protein